MSPQLFALQLAAGAWGITFATAAQVLTAYRLGVRRILLANQLVACAEIEALLTVWNSDPDFDIYIVVDSPFGVERLCTKVIELGSARRLPVLIEMGLPGGRAGCRDPASALDLANTITASAALSLAGVEGYEGLLMSTDRETDLAQVDAFLAQLMAVAQDIDSRRLFSEPEIILSAGGTAYFDRVADAFGGRSEFSRPLIPILRSGCYLTHDHGFYNRLLDEMERRQPKLFSQLPAGGLKPALEVWSIVQSRPEPTLAILTMGKRDASYDIDLPRPLWHHAPYAACSQAPSLPPRALPGDCRIEKMNDQHAYMRVPDSLVSQIRVGDLIGCGISHPCTTFDKWSTLLEVDDEYRVVGVVNTEF